MESAHGAFEAGSRYRRQEVFLVAVGAHVDAVLLPRLLIGLSHRSVLVARAQHLAAHLDVDHAEGALIPCHGAVR